jgi:hypothetical protein
MKAKKQKRKDDKDKCKTINRPGSAVDAGEYKDVRVAIFSKLLPKPSGEGPTAQKS